MAVYYCSDAQVTTLLPSTLTGTDLATEANRNALVRGPAKNWVDSLYPNVAPFPGVSGASGYLVDQSDHAAGDETVTIGDGSGDPVAGDHFRVEGHNALYKVVSWSDPTLTYTWVKSYRSGVETTTTGAMGEFLDDSELEFGTPQVIQQAAMWYARGLAYQILRNSPKADEAEMSFKIARGLLQVGRDGLARTRPWPYRYDAVDADLSDDPFAAGYVNLER